MSARTLAVPAPQILHLVRITLEAISPLSLGSGEIELVDRRRMEGREEKPSRGTEMALVRDANGLPTIPGSALQGVLRHLHSTTYGEDLTKKLFGFADH